MGSCGEKKDWSAIDPTCEGGGRLQVLLIIKEGKEKGNPTSFGGETICGVNGKKSFRTNTSPGGT